MSNLCDIKKTLLYFCQTFVSARLERIQRNISDLQYALTSETKSSAGDKHETGRAMIQLEREKLGQQWAEIEKTKELLAKVPLNTNMTVVGLGSLVKTTKAQYYLSISAGEYKANGNAVFCISLATPIGKCLLGTSVNSTFIINGEEIKILEIL